MLMATGFTELRPPLLPAEAVIEAERCLRCGGAHAPAPCALACPAGVDVPRFIAQVALGDPVAAGRTIFEQNLLGGTCARVCPVEELCEGACVLNTERRRPVAIGRLQRFATDQVFARHVSYRAWAAVRAERISVIGAGPAGLTCAGELAARGFRITVHEARLDFGGLARFAIAPYRIGRDPLPAEAERLARLGVEFRLGHTIDAPERLHALEASADAIFLGIGLGPDAVVRYPGDDLPGIWAALPFIEAVKLGPRPQVGARVVVVGGGNTAVDVAREAVRLGAGEVTQVYRRGEAQMTAYAQEVREARAEGVRFLWYAQPVRFLGTGRVEGVVCQYMRPGEPDASGRPRPEPVLGTEFVLGADTVVQALGQRPRATFLSWIDGLETDGGAIRVDPATGQTGNPRYFAGGDAVNGGATVVEAVRAAKIAAAGIVAWLDGRKA